MAITEAFANTQAVAGTEWSCPRDASYDSAQLQTDDGVYQVFLDLSDMVTDDRLEINIKEKVLSSSTARVAYWAVMMHTQSPAIWVSPPLILMHGWDVTLVTIGMSITVTWSIRKVA